jgi:hypothetical protein
MESLPQQRKTDRGGTTETVQQKSLRLYRDGRVTHLQGDKYQVVGDHGTYTVDHAKQLCECPSRVYCSHRASVEIFAAKRNVRENRKLEAKREEVRRRGAYRPDTSLNDMIAASLDRMGA